MPDNDLGYRMGYKITKAYYDQAADKQKATEDILTIRTQRNFCYKVVMLPGLIDELRSSCKIMDTHARID